jgi:hypothetical protein
MFREEFWIQPANLTLQSLNYVTRWLNKKWKVGSTLLYS